MNESYHFNFVYSTLKFSIAGFFIGGFTLLISYGLSEFIQLLGIECVMSMQATWSIMLILSLITPLYFARHINNLNINQFQNIRTKNIYFNFFELCFLQTSLAIFFYDSSTLCYSTDGQAGGGLVFTAWLSLPILVLLSFIFNRIQKINYQKK